MKNVLCLFALVVLLSACQATLTPGSAKIKADGITVNTSGSHCPYGQAKKGNC